MSKFIFLLLIYFNAACDLQSNHPFEIISDPGNNFTTVAEIPPPAGYRRNIQDSGSFGKWLQATRLRKDKRVFLYNGHLKENQSAQFAVIDMPVGKKDLQQCADVVMRLRAEYLFSQHRYDEICFSDNNGKKYQWTGVNNRKDFDKYLEKVFGWCGSASLEKQLKMKKKFWQIQAGDVLIKGGFPGHAMIVMDIAVNDKGEKVFMLAQGFMPAQDIHIVKNPTNLELSPWYVMNEAKDIITPEFHFYSDQLRTW